MVTSVPENYINGKKLKSYRSCGDENVAPWGTLYPVYSAKNKQIYKNMACAAAHGVTDGIVWSAVLNCATDKFSDASNFVFGLDSNSTSKDCAVTFIYPGDMELIQSFKCYVSLIDTCSDTEFEMPYQTSVSKKEITEWCTSGFVSPYRKNYMYANVFCAICNGENFRYDQDCSESFSRGGHDNGFIALIDEAFVSSYQKETFENVPSIHMACDLKDFSRCRPVLCPSGQLRDGTDRCTYPNILWYDQVYTVLISLTSEEAVNFTEVFHHVNSCGQTNIIHVLKSPLLGHWVIVTILNKITDRTSSNKTNLIVGLARKQSKVRPQDLIQNLKRILKGKWFLKHNVTISFKASILAYTNINRGQGSGHETGIAFGSISQNVTYPRYCIVYKSSWDIPKRNHMITKLYLCYQVELTQSEFILSTDKKLLFNNVTQRVMFTNEFVLLGSSTDDGDRARICVEDSGMYIIGKDLRQNTASFSHVTAHAFLVIAWLLSFL
ncbi:uncharacterized protein LOC123555318 [Mercenaria mercenaria]|uniref:uncharacterized protein LOC123555318 n=1 Tax=Mercenaria mercenaria TaxID=6596 RepID=UPI00234E67E5|nr:uncharacterized protein LOC123555318 [Mercenaria mercenaria]